MSPKAGAIYSKPQGRFKAGEKTVTMAKIETPSGIPEDDFMREGLIDRLSQYIQAEPEAWHVRYNLGVALSQDGRLDEALEHFMIVVQQSPRHVESLVNMGGIYLARKEADLALKAYTKALAVWDAPIVRANMAMAYIQLGLEEEAERELKRALEVAPEMPDAWCNLGSLYLRRGLLEESVKASQKAVEIYPEFGMAHNNLAVAFLELKRLDQAKEHAQKALDLKFPIHDTILKSLGMAK